MDTFHNKKLGLASSSNCLVGLKWRGVTACMNFKVLEVILLTHARHAVTGISLITTARKSRIDGNTLRKSMTVVQSHGAIIDIYVQ